MSLPFSTFCSAGFVDRYHLNLVLSGKILFFLSMLIENFTGLTSVVS